MIFTNVQHELLHIDRLRIHSVDPFRYTASMPHLRTSIRYDVFERQWRVELQPCPDGWDAMNTRQRIVELQKTEQENAVSEVCVLA